MRSEEAGTGLRENGCVLPQRSWKGLECPLGIAVRSLCIDRSHRESGCRSSIRDE